jgi:phosphate transport system protein
MTSHYEESLERDIQRIRSKVAEMAGLAERALKSGIEALRERNRQIAYSVILRDHRIDELEKEIDRLCLEFIVRQQPVAGTLRMVYASIKINAALERVGDYAESIARQALVVSSLDVTLPFERFDAIANLAIPMIRDAAKAFVRQDEALAKSTMEAEDQVDVLRHELNTDLVRMREENQIPLPALAPLMNIVNRLERVADQAKSICQEVLYVRTGEFSKHIGGDTFRVLFVDEHNSGRGPMAEAIGTKLGLPKFVFGSAGIDPRPAVDGAVAFYLKGRGLDIARHKPRSVQQVPHLENYQIIVALAEEAKKAFPPPPSKVVCLDWTLGDPSQVNGTPDQIHAAYEEAYGFLEAHIKDLVEAVVGDGATNNPGDAR